MILTNGGRIANWYIFTNTIASGSVEATANILLDSANSLIRLGSTSNPYITIDGANQRLRSSNYVAGVSGFTVEPSLIEAENLVARGTLKGVTFQYNVVSAVGGQLLVANTDTLASDMTAADSSTMTIKGNTTFAANDMLLIQATTASGIQTEYLRVTSAASAPTYSVTRDLASAYSANSNPIRQTGTTVVKIGSSDGVSTYSGGWLRLIGEGTNAPYYSVFKRTGVAYNAYTEYCRLGNLNGFLSYSSDEYGIAIGETSKYFKYDPTNGLRIAGNIQALTFLTAGENLTAGNSVQIGGDYKALMSQDSYTSSAFATTNYGSANPLYAGNSGSPADIEMWFQFDTSNLPPSTNITSAVLSFNVTSVGGGTHGLSLYRVTGASWVEGTITHNNKPALNGSTFATLAGVNSTGVKTIDITTQVQNWQNGTHNNYGFVIQTDNASSTLAVSSREDATNFPYVTITLASGKVYKASATTSNATNRWLGFCFTTTTAGNSAPIQISNNYVTSGLTTDTPYYQSDTRGAIATSAGTNSKKIGLSTSTTELLILNT